MAKILVADDALFMRNSLKFICEQAGHEVVGVAADGKEAIKLFEELKPDLVTLDILMKGMNGIEALKKLREKDPQVKVIMVTAIGQGSMQKEAAHLGATAYIRKPFKAEDVVATINKALEEGE